MTTDAAQIRTEVPSAMARAASGTDADTREIDVRAPFRHSAGRLGSVFLQALRARRLLGLKIGGRVIVPPRELGERSEWVELGPGARLEAFAPADWLAADSDNSCLALVTVDGADTALLTRLRPAVVAGALAPGARLSLRFAEEPRASMTDFWFEPVGV
jgi:uncharacterized OB-fold protein